MDDEPDFLDELVQERLERNPQFGELVAAARERREAAERKRECGASGRQGPVS